MKEIGSVQYDSSIYHDENTLLNFKLMSAPQLNQAFTYLWGRDSDKFPLLTMTEGQMSSINKRPLNGADTQYKWKIMGREKLTSQVRRLITAVDSNGLVGANGATIIVEMEDNWIPYQYGVLLPDGVTLLRAQSEGKPTGRSTFTYTFATQTGRGVLASNFASGIFVAMQAPTIAASKSDGTRDNKSSFNEATNQFGFHRFSQNIAGNISNKVLDIQFDVKDENGKIQKYNKWIPYQMKKWEIQRKQLLEEDLWRSQYNRDANGTILLKDPDTNENIPRGAGVLEQIDAAGNAFDYSNFTRYLLDMIHDHVNSNRIGDNVGEKVLYCGKGFSREFSKALERDAKFNNYFQALGEKVVGDGTNGYLRYGSYFNQYKLQDGTIFTIKPVNMFDEGSLAELQKKNGMLLDGLPFDSYTAVCLDHSMISDDDLGDTRNVQMVYEQGREFKVGVYKGMAEIPDVWNATPGNLIGDTKDIASYEVICSQGINILNPTTSFAMYRK
jgi:hypothetical protein